MSRLYDLLIEIASVTLPPKGTDEAFVAASTDRLLRLLREYPEPIAIRALEDWPRNNRYFPLEADLGRALNVASEYARFKQESPIKRYDDGMLAEPVGATLEFIKEFRRINPAKCAAYFDFPAKTRWSETRIGTRIQFVPQMVEKYAPGLLEKHGVSVVEPYKYHTRPRLPSDPPGAEAELFDIEWRWEQAR